MLANVYLHYVFDRWARQWRKTANGEVMLVRFADDFVVGFEHRGDAVRFLRDLRERFSKFGLELHPDKTCLIQFGRFAPSVVRSVGWGGRRRLSTSGSRTSVRRPVTDVSSSSASPSRSA
ncbi:MAG: reverse transcriptase domain-containing protein [Steroidobacteraceae bacterium]